MTSRADRRWVTSCCSPVTSALSLDRLPSHLETRQHKIHQDKVTDAGRVLVVEMLNSLGGPTCNPVPLCYLALQGLLSNIIMGISLEIIKCKIELKPQAASNGPRRTARTTPYQAAPHQAAPHQAAPHQAAPHQAAPHQAAPHQAALHQADLHHAAPHQADL
uniref:Uncharacterized protein n=1 Tax=Knipowitschia caucasica TaxID=637954 RepID=A0AAV2MQZ0_KNICA